MSVRKRKVALLHGTFLLRSAMPMDTNGTGGRLCVKAYNWRNLPTWNRGCYNPVPGLRQERPAKWAVQRGHLCHKAA